MRRTSLSDAAHQSVTFDLSFDLPGPEYEEVTWIHNEHGSSSSAPLSRTAGSLAPGMMGAEKPGELPQRIHVNSYSYTRAEQWPPESTLSPHLDDTDLPKDDSNLLDWRERCLPLAEEVVAELDAFDPHSVVSGGWEDALTAQQKRISEAMRLVHSTAVFHAQIFAETFAARYIMEFGKERQTDGLALLQGFRNVSTQRAADLWDLGRIARRSDAVMSAVESGVLPSGDDDDEVSFRQGFEAAMVTYGHMNPQGAEDLPTWRENTFMPISIIRQYAAEDDERSPRLVEQAGIARRKKLEAELSTAARSSEAAEELLKFLPYAQHIGPVTEDHNLLADQRIGNASRARWLKIGELLRLRGSVDQVGDVFYYEVNELLELLESDVHVAADELATRETQLAHWRTLVPPAVIGKGALVADESAEEIVVTGMAAAAGSYTGRARVIKVLTEANTLEEGDVLVCDITTPAWTPYFAIIGAVVTNIGSVLAHGAIVAREFGIPAVVATGNGTNVIPDGATVTVNGTEGTVTVIGE
jgi:phosphohistidine swiveling domain-containing protein